MRYREAMPESGRAARPWVVDLVALAAMLAGLLSLAVSLSGRFALDIDDANLALAVEHFDVRMHQPHPPGYLGYVMLLRAVHALSGAALLDVPRFAARAFGALTVVLVWLAARRIGDAAQARWAALLAATNPIILYYSVDGQTHSAEGAMSAALLWALAVPLAPATRACAVGLLVAAGGSFRPTYLMLAGVAVLFVFGRDWRRLLLVTALAVAGTLAWLIPTVQLTGGWSAYAAANDALVGLIARQVSVFSSEHDARYLALNLRDTLAWSVIALAPLVPLAAKRTLDPPARRAAVLCACMVVPSLLFYSFGFCMEAGYLAGLVAPAALVGGLASPPSGATRARAWAPALAAVAQLGFFLAGPQHIGRTFMLPNIAEILERDLRVGLLYDALHHGLPPDERVLVLSDFPDLTAMRQQPLVRPATDVLFVHDKIWFPAHGESWLSFATAHGWHAIPGIVLRDDGDEKVLHAHVQYSQVVLDPRASDRLRAALRAQMRPEIGCSVAPESDGEAVEAQRWPMSCFGPTLEFFGLTFYF
jgi:Dolichyl-phosphate-mannose-protein mannosyltransferase